MMTNRFIILILSVTILSTTTMNAAVPGLISYQGRLTSAAGNPVADGPYLIKFQIYDVPTAGSPLWNSGYQNVQVTNGLYSYVLGQDVSFPNGLFTGGNRWLGITVGVDPELSPRKQLVAAAYAIASQNADSVSWSGIKSIPAGFADGIDNNSGGDITAVNTAGGLTGGVASGDANLSISNSGVTSAHIGDGQIVNADINASANIAAAKIAGTAATLGGTQTFTGKNTFTDSVFLANNTLVASDGHVTVGKLTSIYDGLLMNVESIDTVGSFMKALQVRAENQGLGEVMALSTIAYSLNGSATGVYAGGISDNYFRYGAYFSANSASSPFTSGISTGAKSTASNGDWAIGVSGEGWSANKTVGIDGRAVYADQEGIGVRGLGTNNPVNNIGTYGGATAGGWGVGVYGEAWNNSTANWAGYFGGDVNVTGTVYMPAKASRIDHPLDPENMYLQQSDVQAPDMLNVYSGNVVTDNFGDAVVTLPDYFMAINSDFRYQLTVVGQFAQAIVSSEIQNNQFSIKTDKPAVKVSWQVTGVRQDRYAQAHRIRPEETKPPHEIGKYLHPELYGLGIDRGMTAAIRAATMQALAIDRDAIKDNPPTAPKK